MDLEELPELRLLDLELLLQLRPHAGGGPFPSSTS
jgi:hypothetical protein